MNLRAIDLNLLVILDALIEERSVRRCGERIGLSQSATSHALERLRRLLGDELLVRTPAGMEPTPRAQELAGPVRLALRDIEAALMPARFDPASAENTFAIAVETYETIILLPGLVDLMQQEAPRAALHVRSGSLEDILAGIDAGRVDVAIGTFQDLPERFMTCGVVSDGHACVVRQGHPLAAAPLTLERYLAAVHLRVSMSGAGTDPVDAALAGQGMRRRVSLQLPHGLAAVVALMRSDLVATVSCGAARAFAEGAPLSILDLPFAMPPTAFRLIWNRRFNDSPAHAWLRRRLVAIGSGIRAADRAS